MSLGQLSDADLEPSRPDRAEANRRGDMSCTKAVSSTPTTT